MCAVCKVRAKPVIGAVPENLETSLLSRMSTSTVLKTADRSSSNSITVTITNFKQNVIVNASDGGFAAMKSLLS